MSRYRPDGDPVLRRGARRPGARRGAVLRGAVLRDGVRRRGARRGAVLRGAVLRNGVRRRGARRALAMLAATTLSSGLLWAGVVPGTEAPARAQTTGQQCDADDPQYLGATPPAFGALGVDRAQEISRGQGVTVAVVDSGVHVQNEHLRGVVSDGVNVVDGDDPYNRDADSHGTFVAGIIAARQVEGSGVVGVAPRADIQSVRVYYGRGEQAEREDVHLTPARIAAGIQWAAENGAEIINVSLSTDRDHPDLRAAVEDAQDAGALIVASAGNRQTAEEQGEQPRYPAAYDGVLGVSAVDRDGVWHPVASFETPDVDVAAPGQQVPSAFLYGGDCVFNEGDSAPSSSWATAYVSGAAALIAARYPQETAEQWAHRLQATASRAGTWERDDRVGWGIIQPVAALQFIDDGSAPGPPSPVHGASEPMPAPTSDIELAEPPDPMAPAQNLTRWWLVGSAALITLALLYSRTRPRRAR
ncbi:MAG TPA: S8 family serine peptidase [Beutenbergiaceae bacterium]|nr:S8 family serine peptidase [Beutenbergiaceae bacterium]